MLDTPSKFGFVKINVMKENTVQDNADKMFVDQYCCSHHMFFSK